MCDSQLCREHGMYEAKVFAVLIPDDYQGLARDAFRLRPNAGLYHQSSKGIVTEPGLSSREPTPALSVSEHGDNDNNHDSDRLILTFDDLPRNPQRGWQFGTDPRTSDVLLGHRGTHGVSARHFLVKIDEDRRVVLRDTSTFGTSVSYDGQAEYEVRQNFTWILSLEPGSTNSLGETVLRPGKLAFRIHFPNHRLGKSEYLSSLQNFINAGRVDLPTVTALGLDSGTTTAIPSHSRTPGQGPIYVNLSLIGQGEFGAVHRVIDVSTGNIYAGKRFRHPFGNAVKGKRKLDHDKWMNGVRNETSIMKENPHVSNHFALEVSLVSATSVDLESCLPSERRHLVRVCISVDELYRDMRQERDGTIVVSFCTLDDTCPVMT